MLSTGCNPDNLIGGSMGKLISLSTMREIVVPSCVVGQMVRYTGDMANAAGTGAVVAIRPAGPYNAHQSYDVALEDGREFCGTHLDGSRWIVMEASVDALTVDILRAGVEARKATEKAKATAAAQEFAATVARIRAEYPYLRQGEGCVLAATNIRTELKRAFPGVKFRVTTSKYSGGNSVRVAWTDGPTTKAVEAIANKYAGGWFDGMTDCYEHKRSPWTEVFGDAKYVFCERNYSDAMLQEVIAATCERLGGMDAVPTVEDYKQGRLWTFKQSGGCDVEREIRQALQEAAK
jgi:hypothetical protein